jgi:D-alanyl-D-alanine carboxypeptidase
MYQNIFILLLSLWASQVYSKTIPITATSWLVADGTGRVIQNENSQELRSIASISKLMTVIVVLDARQDLDEYIKPYTRRELIQLALVKSDNTAAKTLCEKYPGGSASCIRAMNTKAHFNAMPNTNFIEPTGLSVFNVSTAEDLVKMVMLASTYPEIVESSKTSQIKINIRKKWLIFNNTNPIIGQRHEFIVSKTGYIRASGGCIVMMLDTDIGRRIVIVLGSKNTHTRIPEAEFIAQKN